VSLAFCWCYIVGVLEIEQGKKLPVLKHGRPQYTVPYFGLDKLSEALLQNDNQTILRYIRFLSRT
jgi:hypothetical protein